MPGLLGGVKSTLKTLEIPLVLPQNEASHSGQGTENDNAEDNINVSEFELMYVDEVYSSLDDKELWFLGEDGNEIKVESISKVDYSGKIYDVDVSEHNVVLVRRNNLVVWSGNSNNKKSDVSQKCYETKWKFFKDLDKTEKVATLNTETGETEYQKPTEYQTYDYDGEMYRIKTSEGDLLVSPEHKIYGKIKEKTVLQNPLDSVDLVNSSLNETFNDFGKVKERENYLKETMAARGNTLDPSSFKVIILPLKSSGFDFSLSNLENSLNNAFGLSCGILNQTTENIACFENCSIKSSSLVTNILFSDLENLASFPFESPFCLNITLNPCCLRNINNSFLTFSSSRNFSSFFFNTDNDIIITSCNGACIMQGCFNMLFSERSYKACNNFFNRNSCFEHFQNLPNHNSSTFESRFSMADFTVNNNVFVNFNSHDIKNIEKGFINVLDDYELVRVKDVYSSLDEKELWFLTGDGEEIKVDDIVLEDYFGKIYDVDVPLDDVILVRRGNEDLQNLKDFEKKTDEKDTENGEKDTKNDEKATLKATLKATEMKPKTGHDSGADFDEICEAESGEFECFKGSADELLERKATMMEWGDTTGKQDLQTPNIPEYLVVWSGNSQHDIDWKVGCYDDLGIQWNSSEYLLELSARTTMSKPNIGAHAFYDENYVVMQHRFERTNGTDFFDETGINNGTRVGDVKWCPDEGDSTKYNCSGRVGKGVLFDGAGDEIVITKTSKFFNFTDEGFSVSTWVKPAISPQSAEAGILENLDEDDGYKGYYLGVGAGGDGNKFRVYHVRTGSSTNFLSDNTFSANTWYYVVTTYDGSTVYMYVDGVQQTSTGSFTGNLSIYEDMRIGNYDKNGGIGWDGSIDEVTIWNRSLSATEVAQLYYSSADSYNSTYTIQDISASNNNTHDKDNDTIKYIYDWYVNNESMAVLNMPFEAVNNGSEMNFSRDYSDNENHATTTSFDGAVYNGDSGWNRTGGVDGFGAYEFDGAGDYLDLGNDASLDVNNFMTISVWVKPKSLPATSDILSKYYWDDGGYSLSTVNDDVILFVKSSSYLIYAYNVLSVDSWTHIVYTINNDVSGTTVLTSYIDGVYGSTETESTDVDSTTDNFYIGNIGRYGTNFYGTIDELLVFNRSLSAEQVLALYRNQTQTIKSQETNKGESWKAEVTANDGYGDSIAYNTSEIVLESVTLTLENIYPSNRSIVNTNQINFTYNVTDGSVTAGVMNCSLFLGYNTTNTKINSSNNIIETEVNQTFNLTFPKNTTHTYYWKLGCYDKDNEQTNSSMWYVKRTEKPIIQALSLNSSFDTNFSNENLTCFANATDIDLDNLTFHGFWYKNGIQQFFEWNKTASVGDSYAIGLAVDSEDNIIMNGYTNTTGAGNFDLWVIKYDSDGNELWNETLGGSSADKGYKITVDSEDNIIAAGHTDSFGPGGSDVILVKYDSDGNQMWNVTEGGGSSDFGYDVEVDSENNVIAAGLTNSYGAGDFDMWILKYDSSGNYLWNTTVGGSESEHSYGIAIDSEDNILVAGFTKSFGGIDHDFFTVKYDSNGNHMWNVTEGGSGIDLGWDVGVDSSDNVIITGYANSYGAGNSDMWTIKYDSSGSHLWNKTFGWAQNEVSSGVAVDSEDNIIIHGHGKPTGLDAEYYHFVTVKYNSDGDQLWNISTASQTKVDIGKDIKLDSEDNIIINGYISFWTAAAGYWHYNIWLIKYYGYSLENQLQDNDLINISTLDSLYTTKDDIWGCRVRAYDGIDYSSYNFTNNITIDDIILKVDNQAPNNDTTIVCLSSVNITYNVSDESFSSTINNCSLFLGYNTINANHLNKTDTGIEKTINQTMNLTFVVNNTWIYWKIGCYDNDHDQTNSSLRRFFLSDYCPPGPPGPEHPGSSSGLGVSGERGSSKITESMQTVFGNVYGFNYMIPGVTVLELSDPALSVYRIELDVSKELEDVELEIKEGMTTYVKKPKGDVYRYVIINKNNLPASAVNEIVIYFKVQKNLENVNLMYHDGDWEELEIEKVSETFGTEEYYDYYKASSKKLSLFSIVSKKEKKPLIKFFRPGLITKDIEEEADEGIFDYLEISVFGVIGLIGILLFMFVRAKLKGRRFAKVKRGKR